MRIIQSKHLHIPVARVRLRVCACVCAVSLPETFSSAFADFLALCLDKTPNLRPSAKDLLKHPWLKQPPSLDRTASGSSSRGESSSRHDRNHESPPLERSRSNLSAQLDISGPLAAMSLGASE